MKLLTAPDQFLLKPNWPVLDFTTRYGTCGYGSDVWAFLPRF